MLGSNPTELHPLFELFKTEELSLSRCQSMLEALKDLEHIGKQGSFALVTCTTENIVKRVHSRVQALV